MSRNARGRSITGKYHIILKGIDNRDLFLDEYDKEQFVKKMMEFKSKVKFKLYAYCLLDNHVHLLIGENDEEDIGFTIKRIAVSYVFWHNIKYGRTGHLFQNRYRSEAIDTERYFVTVTRYIHQNPIKAGLVKGPENYLWSSYNQYITSYQGNEVNVDVEAIHYYFNTQKEFVIYMNAPNNDECLKNKYTAKYSDTYIKSIINEIFTGDLSDLPKNDRNEIICKIHERSGASIRQLERVLGIGKRIVEMALKCDR